MAKAKSDAVWVEIDPASLPQEQQVLYQEYKAQYAVMKAGRELFERSLGAGAPEGQRMVFGYNFGKLSIALVADDRKPAAKGKQSLSDFLAAQTSQGRRA